MSPAGPAPMMIAVWVMKDGRVQAGRRQGKEPQWSARPWSSAGSAGARNLRTAAGILGWTHPSTRGNGPGPASATSAAPAPRATVALLLAGLALLAAFVAALLALPRGPSEFAYAPDLFAPLPFAAMRGFTFEQLASYVLRLALLLPALLLLAAGLSGRVRLEPRGPEAVHRLARLGGATALLVATMVTALLAGRALTADELTYRMQAELFLQGRLFEDRYPPWGHEAFTIWTERGATGKYLFGEPLVQALGVVAGLPALLHLPLAAVTLLAWFGAVRRRAGPETAGWATLLVAWSPMFLLTTGTGLSHATSLAGAAAAALGYEWLRAERPAAGAALLGGAMGFVLAVRPQVAFALGVVLGPLAAWLLLRRRRWAALALLAAGVLAGTAAVALYNRAVTGSPLVLPWSLYHPAEQFGFGLPIEGSAYRHGPWQAAENLLVSVVRFNSWWPGWPVSLALVLLPGALGRSRGGLGPWPAVALALVAVHLPYYSPGVSDTGPVYYYELLLPASLAGAHALRAAFAHWGGRSVALVGLAFLLGTGTFLVEHVARLRRLVEAIHAPAEAVLAAIEPPALLLCETSPQEALHPGWLFGFPVRERHPDAAVLTFPRGAPEQAARLRSALPGRACWYYRLEPPGLAPQLVRCEAARGAAAAAAAAPGTAEVRALHSTASGPCPSLTARQGLRPQHPPRVSIAAPMPGTTLRGRGAPARPPKAYLFDLDGVLVRTEELHHAAYRAAVAARGHELPWSFPRYCVAAHYGQAKLREELAAAVPGLLPDEPAWLDLFRDKSERYLALLASSPVELQPGAASTLRRLDAAGAPRAVVTNATREQTAVLRLRQPILDSAPVWVTREDYAAAKPAPDGYQMALARLGVGPDGAVGFEDTPRGLQALTAAGVEAILVTTIAYPELGTTPALTVDTLAALPEELLPAVSGGR